MSTEWVFCKQGSGDSGRSSFEAAAQTPLSEPVNAPPSANDVQPEAEADKAQADPKASSAMEEKGTVTGAQADPDTDLISVHQQSNSKEEGGSAPSNASTDGAHDTGTAAWSIGTNIAQCLT